MAKKKELEHKQITVTKETQEELLSRKSKCSWKTSRPKLTWDDFLLDATKRWGE